MDSECSNIYVTGESNVPLQRRNAYGSTIADNSFDYAERIMDMEQTEESAVVTCVCKGQCLRKKGRGSCLCKAANKKCTDQCRCNPVKCKNKSGEPTATPSNDMGRRVVEQDALVQFENDVRTSVTDIQEFIASLSAEKKDEILISLLVMGRGSLDFAKNLVGSVSNPPPPKEPSPQWCICQYCREMESDIEKVCCKRKRCITLLDSFSNICLDRDNLEVTIKSRCDFRADEFDFTMESFRKAAYYRYIIWRFGKLGRGNRRVVPSCAVWAIRGGYPSANGQYMGYRAS